MYEMEKMCNLYLVIYFMCITVYKHLYLDDLVNFLSNVICFLHC